MSKIAVIGLVGNSAFLSVDKFHEGGETVATWRDGSSAVQKFTYGKGRVYLFGFSIGYSYYTAGDLRLAKFAERILDEAGVQKNALSDTLGGIYEKRLVNGEYEIVHLFNKTEEEKHFDLRRDLIAVGGHGVASDGKLAVPAHSMGYAVIKAE